MTCNYRCGNNYWEQDVLPEATCCISELSCDMRRMLRIQFKEFIHLLEEAEALDAHPGDSRGQLSLVIGPVRLEHGCSSQ